MSVWRRIRRVVSVRKEPVVEVNASTYAKEAFVVTQAACADLELAIHQIISYPDHLDGSTYELINEALTSLGNVVVSESNPSHRTGSKRVCALYFLHSNFYYILCANLRSYPDWLLRSVIALINILFQQDPLLCDKSLILGTNVFLHAIILARANVIDYEDSFVDLLSSIVFKMKQNSELLPKWFSYLGISGIHEEYAFMRSPEAASSSSPPPYHKQFPMTQILIDYVCHCRRSGTIARQCLLDLVNVISESPQLESWIIQSDFCALLASSLASLFIAVKRAGFSHSVDLLAINESNQSFDSLMSNVNLTKSVPRFRIFLEFWQSLVGNCNSGRIKNTLLGYFDVIFIKQTLLAVLDQPSVEFFTLLTVILDDLDHNELSQMIVCSLFDINLDYNFTSLILKNTKSIDSPALDNRFSLADSVVNILDSNLSEQELIQLLHLILTLIEKYYPYITRRLVNIENCLKVSHKATVGNDLLNLYNIIVDLGTKSYAVGNYDYEQQNRLINSPYFPTIQLDSPTEMHTKVLNNISLFEKADISLEYHLIVDNDPLLSFLLNQLRSFFSNSQERNHVLVEILLEMSINPLCSPTTWLLDNTGRSVVSILQSLATQYQRYAAAYQFATRLHEYEQGETALSFGADSQEEISTQSLYSRIETSRSGKGKDNRRSPSNHIFKDINALLYSDERYEMTEEAAYYDGIGSTSSNSLWHDQLNTPVQIRGVGRGEELLFGNILILREFVKNIEAVVRARSWGLEDV